MKNRRAVAGATWDGAGKRPPGRKALCAGVGKHPLLMLLMKLLKSLIRKSAMQSAVRQEIIIMLKKVYSF